MRDPARTRRRAAALALAAALLHAAPPAQAQRPVADLLQAVVGVEAEIAPDARTAGTLGTSRSGSGVVIDGSGLVVTVGYLVLEAHSAQLVVAGRGTVPATVVGYDHDSGLGLLRAREDLGVTPLALGDSQALERGDRALVASRGGPAAVQPAVVVSRRSFAGYWEYLLESAVFAAPAHPLYGGAALLDEEGRLLGIGSLAVSDAMPGPRPLPGNVFIPVSLLQRVLPDLLVAGRSQSPARPWLGLYADDARGPVTVRRVADDSPAEAAGLAAGDVLLGVGEQPTATLEDFYRALWASGEAGDTIALKVLRAGALEDVPVRTGDRYDWLRIPQAPRTR